MADEKREKRKGLHCVGSQRTGLAPSIHAFWGAKTGDQKAQLGGCGWGLWLVASSRGSARNCRDVGCFFCLCREGGRVFNSIATERM